MTKRDLARLDTVGVDISTPDGTSRLGKSDASFENRVQVTGTINLSSGTLGDTRVVNKQKFRNKHSFKNISFPTSVIITDHSIISVPFDYSTHNLYDIIPGVCITGTYHYNLEGVSIPLLCQPVFGLNITLLYLDNNYDFRCLNEPHNLRLSRIQFGPNLFSYGYVTRGEILRYALYLTHAGDKS